MPFDKISPSLLRAMRRVTSAMFLALGAALLALGGTAVLDAASSPGLGWVLPAVAFVQGAFLANAGVMLAELTTRAPYKVGINVPFVAANCQTALTVGLVALGPALHPTPFGGAPFGAVSVLVLLGFGMNLVFVVMTKMHWNFTENTGKALPE
ncbi:MAG: hypothetical protein H0V89_07480 [Deltaproteobacteria bacterium]|nr:hypothetical protein [Deltaproteobacteria bacterium]